MNGYFLLRCFRLSPDFPLGSMVPFVARTFLPGDFFRRKSRSGAIERSAAAKIVKFGAEWHKFAMARTGVGRGYWPENKRIRRTDQVMSSSAGSPRLKYCNARNVNGTTVKRELTATDSPIMASRHMGRLSSWSSAPVGGALKMS